MKYKSTRFGTFEVNDDAILNFPDGLYGFEQETRFALLPFASNIDSPLEWLHSLMAKASPSTTTFASPSWR